MKKLFILFGILFLFVNFVFAQDYLYPPAKRTGRFVAVDLAAADKDSYKTYCDELEKMIFAKWNPEKTNTGLRAGFIVKVNKDGSLSGSEIYTSSGSIEFDKSAFDVLDNFKQLKPLPENYPFPYTKALITFSDNAKNYEDIDFAPYMQNLQKTIKSYWNPPKVKRSQLITVLFKMHKDGTITDAKIICSDGIPALENAALDAINAVNGKFPLPQEFQGKSIDIQFTFSYGVYGADRIPMNPLGLKSDFSLIYKEIVPKKLYATTKMSIRTEDGYKYLNVLQTNNHTSNAYLLKCKVDCKNRQIGVKRSYAGSPREVLANPRTIFLYNLIFHDNVKMYSIDEKPDYQNIYEYVCQP